MKLLSSRSRNWFALILISFGALVCLLAGEDIQNRFFYIFSINLALGILIGLLGVFILIRPISILDLEKEIDRIRFPNEVEFEDKPKIKIKRRSSSGQISNVHYLDTSRKSKIRKSKN